MFSIIKLANKASYNSINNGIASSNSLKLINIYKYSNKDIENKESILPEISNDLNKWLEKLLERVIEKERANGWCLRFNKEVYLNQYGIGKLTYDNKIFKFDKDFLKVIYNQNLLLVNQREELSVLVESNFKMPCHPIIYNEKEGIVYFSTKTSKNKPFNYYSENKLQKGNVIKLGEKSYLSDLKYKVFLFKKDSFYWNTFIKSIKENESLMKHYGFDKNNLIHYKNQTDTFDKIEKTADITDQILAKLSVINLIYDKVYENYMNGIITEIQWKEFLELYKIKLKELDLDILDKSDKPEL
jgi:hypothetical protein